MTTVILVEGTSDQGAIEALALRLGRDLHSEGVSVVGMGGATNIRRFVEDLRPTGVTLTGLYDVGERRYFEKVLGAHLEAQGFFACENDIEDELIRALGPEGVEALIEARGRAGKLATFRRQPAQRERDRVRQLKGYMSNDKIGYARLMVEALDLARIPAPLAAVLARV